MFIVIAQGYGSLGNLGSKEARAEFRKDVTVYRRMNGK